VYYQQQHSKGHTHHEAVRARAFKWIRIVFRCWQDRVAYDANTYLAALVKRGSPLARRYRSHGENVVETLWILGESHPRGRQKSA
jgi:hypothetical protein